MTPGLGRGPPFPSKAKKNAIIAIASLERPSVPRVVGECDIDISSLQQVQGAKGRAVRGHHWEGDEIWAWSQGGKPGGESPDEIEGWDLENQTDNLGKGVEGLSMDDSDDDGGVLLVTEADERSKGDSHSDFVKGENAPASEEEAPEEKEMSTKGVLKLRCRVCLLYLLARRNRRSFLERFLVRCPTSIY